MRLLIAIVLTGCSRDDRDRDGASASVDCDDRNATVYPGADELCDGIDNDCNDLIDDDPVDGEAYHADADGDGFGEAEVTGFCGHPLPGYIRNGDDCNDSSAAAWPGATEVCDGIDNDCDGTADEDAQHLITFYEDRDGDGYGVLTETTTGCTVPDGYAEVYGDCNDSNASLHPETAWHPDRDGDGFGDDREDETQRGCERPDGHVLDNSDCNDSDDAVSPDAAEVCDGEDTDCDGFVAEDDKDNDGDGEAECEGDCDDSDGAIYPGAAEDCFDDIDSDCDGRLSNSCPIDVGDASVTLSGHLNSDYFGYALSAGGDINADGRTDLLIGAYGSDLSGSNRGAASVFFGPLDSDRSAQESDIIIESTGGFLGLSVSAGGDSNDDGHDDLLVSGRTHLGKGAVYLFHGPLTASSLADLSADVSVVGADVDDGLHAALVDLDGDGQDELVSNVTDSWTGLAVFAEPEGGLSAPDDATLTINGGNQWDEAGTSTAFADLTGDGITDVAMGAPGASRGFLLYGPITTSSNGNDADLQLRASSGVEDAVAHLAAGDFNGDGYADLVVGSPESDHGCGGCGLVAVFYGPLTTSLDVEEDHAFATHGALGGSRHGSAYDGIHTDDIDGDGFDELVHGVPESSDSRDSAGALFVHYGPLSGLHSTTTYGRAVYGPTADDHMGSSVDVADVTGDGSPDLIGGAYRAGNTGEVYVFDSGWF